MRADVRALSACVCVAAAIAAVGALAGCSSSAASKNAGGKYGDSALVDAGPDAMLEADGATNHHPGHGGVGAGAADASADLDDASGPSGNDPDAAAGNADAATDSGTQLTLADLPYAKHVVSFTAGTHAGFGQGKLPDVVLGPPKGNGTGSGGLDVVSLGVGGTIVLDFGTLDIVDQPGPDFIVFENPFWPSGDPKQVFADPGEVSVSDDGTTWHTFPCDAAGDGMGHYVGCAGWTPTLKYDPLKVVPLDPSVTGGDAFDLADLSLTRVRYVRIHDLATTGAGNTAGFDLDAVGLVHDATQQ